MKKIAMLNCMKLNEICAGASCMRAFNEKKASFARYEGEEISLVAFMRCNGCDALPDSDEGLREKLDRLETIGTEVVHVGVCTKQKDGSRCPTMQTILDAIERRGIPIVDGTH